MNPSRKPEEPGFTLVALLVIVAVLAILAAMLLPALASAKKKAQRINCVNNLKQSALAFRIWEGDHDDMFPMQTAIAKGGTKEFNSGADTFRHFQVVSNELSTPKILICPADTRTVAANFNHLKNANVSYFVCLEAQERRPQIFLNGDRNIVADTAPENGILKVSPGQRLSWTTGIHNNAGNLSLSDGSVQQLSNSRLTEMLRSSGGVTNTFRLSLPELF